MTTNRFTGKTLDYVVLDVRYENGRYEVRATITDRGDWTRYSQGWIHASPFDAEYAYDAQINGRTPEEEVVHLQAMLAKALNRQKQEVRG